MYTLQAPLPSAQEHGSGHSEYDPVMQMLTIKGSLGSLAKRRTQEMRSPADTSSSVPRKGTEVAHLRNVKETASLKLTMLQEARNFKTLKMRS